MGYNIPTKFCRNPTAFKPLSSMIGQMSCADDIDKIRNLLFKFINYSKFQQEFDKKNLEQKLNYKTYKEFIREADER